MTENFTDNYVGMNTIGFAFERYYFLHYFFVRFSCLDGRKIYLLYLDLEKISFSHQESNSELVS
jgi:hypothetical protein